MTCSEQMSFTTLLVPKLFDIISLIPSFFAICKHKKVVYM